MALNHSPKIVTNGLVFYYDQNNPKSYKGPAMQNLLTQLNSNYGSTPSTATGRSYSGGVQFMDIPQLGYSRVAFTNMQNNYTSFVPNSTDCCPSPHSYYGNFTVSPSTVYTYGIVYKCLSGYTNANYMYRYEYTASNGTYVTEGGAHDPNKRIHLGDNWYWAWNTFTTQPTTNWIMYAGSFYYRYSPVNDQLLIAKIMITPGDYTQLHPRYWPEVNTSRLNTQSLFDLTGQNTINVASLTYASDGSFSFDGSTNYVTTPLSLGSTDPIVTINMWVKRTANFSGAGYWGLGGGSSNNGINGYTSVTNKIGWDLWGQTTFHTGQDYPLNQWVNVCWVKTATTFTTSTLKVYINGVEYPLTTTVRNNSSSVNLATGFTVGRLTNSVSSYYAPGEIGMSSVYNRALTQEEIQQNFNALRGRYGI